jgi:NAD(P)-dependent dehydrogenase (short-subunit alcohol dehydrogenase family)
MKLNDKVAVVTGTSPNIGGGIAEALAAEGATLVCVDALAANAADCANAIKDAGGKAIGITCDIRVNSLTPTATDPTESDERAARWGRNVPAASAARVAAFDMYRRRVPMQKLPRPSDYGHAAAFLASQDANMITGTDLRIDAGAVARYWAWEPSGGQS